MNCGKIDELSPLFHSGELSAADGIAFEQHLAECSPCADFIETSRALDNRLRLACRRPSPQPARWLAAAAVVVLAVTGGRQTPRIFSDAARDHHAEVVDKAARRWKTSDADVDVLFARFGRSAQRQLLGYRLLRAKFCGLAGKRVLHLVYSDGRAEYSVYLTSTTVPDGQIREGAENITGFRKGLVVSDSSRGDCRRLAEAADAVL
jgi:anti-sigma factor RsiW